MQQQKLMRLKEETLCNYAGPFCGEKDRQRLQDLAYVLLLLVGSFGSCCSITQLCPTLQSHRLQHVRLSCPSLSPGVCSNLCPLSWQCYLTISSPLASFYCLKSFPVTVFSNELALRIGWPQYWSFSFSISPSNEYSGWISLRIDWLDLLDAQGTLKSLLQHHNLQFFSTQHSLWSSSHTHT